MVTGYKPVKIAFLAAFMIFTGINGYPEPTAAPAHFRLLSINDAVKTALQNNHEYRIALRKMEEAREKMNQVLGMLMPVLESEASALRQGAENGFMSLSDGQYDIRIVQLKFAINPGMFYNTLKQSYDGYGIAKLELERQKGDIEFNVIKNYFDLILADEMVSLRKNSITLLKENLKDVKRLYQTGSVPKFELLQAQVNASSQETALLEAEYNRRLALDMFNYQLGSDSVNYGTDKSVIEKSTIRIPAGDEIIPHLVEEAVRNRPEILQVSGQRDIAEHAGNTYQSSYIWPTFSIVGGYGKTYLLPSEVDLGLDAGAPINPDFSQITGSREWQDTWQIRVAATYRWGALFPVDTNRAQEREQREKLKEIEERLSQIKRLTAISIRANFARLKASYEAIISQKKNVKTAEEGLRIARESYRAGVIKNAELLGAELLVTQSRTGLIKSIYDYYLSVAALNKEAGTDVDKLIFAENKNE